MNDQVWWAAQMSGRRARYALCSGGFTSSGVFTHDGRHCKCGEAQVAPEAHVAAEREEK